MAGLRRLSIFLFAVIVGTLLVSLGNTHVDLQALIRAGAEIPTAVRMDAIKRDLIGFAPTLFALILLGYAIAFPVAGFTARLLGPGWRRFGFTLAGGVAIAAMMMGIKVFYSTIMDSTITPVAASRDLQGLLTLCLGGAVGGYIFAALQPANRPE